MKRILVVLIAILLGLAACTDKKSSNPNPNRPPETHLFLSIGDALGVIDSTAMPDTSASMLVLHWYGDDPDGEVVGYEWAWDDTSNDSSWTFTELTMDTFYVKIDTVFEYFTFYIRAVDSDSLSDPTPSYLTFPIVNSPPTVNFPSTFIDQYSSDISITLGYHTFTWISSDPDGDESISRYEICLLDSSARVENLDSMTVDWVQLDSLTFKHTFMEIDPGFYRVFLRTLDIAGAYSEVVYYPETTGVWQVIEANGEILYVDDNQYFSEAADSMFITMLDDLGAEYTSLNFQEKAIYYSRDFELALSDFDILIYNAGSIRHFSQTATAITNFINSGGHVMMNVTYSNSDTITHPFMPVDTVYDTDVFRPYRFTNPDTLNSLGGYPDTLGTSQLGSFSNTYTFSPKEPDGLIGEGYKAIYVIENSFDSDPEVVGDTVAIRFPYNPLVEIQEPAKLVFFSFPVFDCNVDDGFRQIITHVLLNEFADE